MSGAILEIIKKKVESILPGYMFVVVHESLERAGYTVRDDLKIFAQRALRAQFEGLDELAKANLIDRTNTLSDTILRSVNADKVHHVWVALAHAILQAAQRGVDFDRNVLLLATAIETDLVDYADEYGGLRLITKLANRIDNTALAEGFWRSPGPLVIN